MSVAVVSLLLPVVGFLLLAVVPSADAHWEHGAAHFWLILATALVTPCSGWRRPKRRGAGTRGSLVSLAFLVTAGFLALHVLATPGSLVHGRNVGFAIATPIGLTLASVSRLRLLRSPGPDVDVEHEGALLAGVLARARSLGRVSLAGLPPLDGPLPEGEVPGPDALAIVVVPLFGWAAWRTLILYRGRGGALPLSLAAWVLLAEAMLAIALSAHWQLSWWEWHVLMPAASRLVA